MAKLIEFHEGARRDFDESFDWYAQRSIEAAVAFAFEVDEALGKITADPGCYP